MVLTDRQRTDLHAGIYEYLLSQPGEGFAKAAAALADADPDACKNGGSSVTTNGTGAADEFRSSVGGASVPLLEKKWTAVPRLQKKVLELERTAAQNAKMYAHRTGDGSSGQTGPRRMLPRPPAVHTLQGHSAVVSTVAVHPVFTVAVSGSEDGTIKVWDHESGEYVRTLKGHTNTVHSLSFTPTGSHLASSSSDLSIKLWDFSTYTCIRTLRGHDHTISAVRFIPLPASALATASTANPAAITSTAGETTASSTTGIDSAASGSAYLLSASRDRTVKFWDVETGFCDHTLNDHTDWVRCVAVREEDGSLLATSGNDQVVNVYRSTGDRARIAELRGHEHVVESVAFVTAAAPASSGAAPSGKERTPQSEVKHAETVRDYVVSGGRDRTVRLWSISGVSCLAVFNQHENWVRSVLIHPSGNYVLSSGDDKSIRVFDIKSNRCLRTLDSAHPHFVTCLAMHHTLPILVSGGVDQTVKCWQLD